MSIHRVLFASLVAAALGGAPAAASAAPSTSPALAHRVPREAEARRPEAPTYAARETRSPTAARFTGGYIESRGRILVISTTTVAIVLAVVLLVVLL